MQGEAPKPKAAGRSSGPPIKRKPVTRDLEGELQQGDTVLLAEMFWTFIDVVFF